MVSKLIGRMRNNWRQRDVFIYEIEGDEDNVRTIGVPFDKSRETIETVELKSSFKRAIDMYPAVYTYN